VRYQALSGFLYTHLQRLTLAQHTLSGTSKSGGLALVPVVIIALLCLFRVGKEVEMEEGEKERRSRR